MFSEKDRKELLKLARESIEQEFSKREIKIPEKFNKKRGVFVTLTLEGELKGCIGFPYAYYPLGKAIVEAAKSAAFSDFRFMPLNKNELNKIKIEISVLSVPKKCDVKDIKIGRDGLICEYRGRQGLLLPQVAVEYKWNREEFLDALCEKAGLETGKWKDKEFNLWQFEAEVFSEK